MNKTDHVEAESKRKVVKLKTLDPEQKMFTANGKTYEVTNQISTCRFSWYQKIELELIWGMTTKERIEAHNRIQQAINEGDIAEVAIINRELRDGAKIIDAKREPFILRLCALIINEVGEDPRYISEEMIDKKIQDWYEEGYDIKGFFQLALAIIPDLAGLYNDISLDISRRILEQNRVYEDQE